MLHFISWKMYGISLMVGLVIFYGYVIYKNMNLLKVAGKRLWVMLFGEREPEKKVALEKGAHGDGEASGSGPADKGPAAG